MISSLKSFEGWYCSGLSGQRVAVLDNEAKRSILVPLCQLQAAWCWQIDSADNFMSVRMESMSPSEVQDVVDRAADGPLPPPGFEGD